MKYTLAGLFVAIIINSCNFFEDNTKLVIFESENCRFPALFPDSLKLLFEMNHDIDLKYSNIMSLADSADILFIDYALFKSKFESTADSIPSKYKQFMSNNFYNMIPIAFKRYKIYSNSTSNINKPTKIKTLKGPADQSEKVGIPAKSRQNFLSNFYACFNYLGGEFNSSEKGGIYNSKNINALEKYVNLATNGLIETIPALKYSLEKHEISEFILPENISLRNLPGIEENNFPESGEFVNIKLLIVNRNSANKNAVGKFLDFILSDSLSRFFTAGLPDIHYTLPLKGNIDVIEKLGNWKKLPKFRDLNKTEKKLYNLVWDVLVGRESASQALKYFEGFVSKNQNKQPINDTIKKEIMKMRKKNIN